MAGLNTAEIIDRANSLGVSLSPQEAQNILDQAWDQGQWGADEGAVMSLLRSDYSPEGTQIASSPEDYIQSITEDAFDPFEEAGERASEYMEENPWAFDEELARASSEERFDPYYEAQLRDYLTGVNRAKGRTVQDEERLRQELTRDTEQYVGRARKELDNALEASEQGFAGSGLFFSGAREKTMGETTVRADEDLRTYQRKQDLRGEESRLRQERTLEDLATQEATQRREIGAARETDILSDIAQQEREQQQSYWWEVGQAAGYPLTTGSQSLSSIFGI